MWVLKVYNSDEYLIVISNTLQYFKAKNNNGYYGIVETRQESFPEYRSYYIYIYIYTCCQDNSVFIFCDTITIVMLHRHGSYFVQLSFWYALSMLNDFSNLVNLVHYYFWVLVGQLQKIIIIWYYSDIDRFLCLILN